MEIRTFEAFNMKDLIKKVKDNLGNDAFILETKTKKSNDSGQIIYEVTAAPAAESYERNIGATQKPSKSHSESDILSLYRKITELEEKVERNIEKQLKHEHLFPLESSVEEIRALLMSYMGRKNDSLFKGVPGAVAAILKKMSLMDVDHEFLVRLSRHLVDSPEPPQKDQEEDYYKVLAMKWMMKRSKVSPRWNVLEGEKEVHILVGTSGVGKSSLVCKLAAEYHLKEKRKVLIISYDNHRLGSSDQMRLYTKMLGVSFETIAKPQDLKFAIDSHKDCEVILVDTAGRSPRYSHSIEDLSNLKDIEYKNHTHLVLSMTDHKVQVDRSIKSFMNLGISSLMFSKMDESWSYGEIFNSVMRWGIPISWFSVGHNVPEDLERATRERVIERILGC